MIPFNSRGYNSRFSHPFLKIRVPKTTMHIRLGTRQSPLALWQAEYVSKELTNRGHEVELVRITTSGDVSTTPLGQSGGQGLFTKEIQRALLDNRCDLAVHSLKDLPTETVDGLRLAAVPPRENAADCLIATNNLDLGSLPEGAKIGTGSPRRKAQLLHHRPDLQILDIRGNVDTRLRKLDSGDYDAILLAYAGLHRLGLSNRITSQLNFDQMLPAVGQAALGLEVRSDDEDTWNAVSPLSHLATHLAVLCERSLLRSLRAGCLAPLAAHAIVDNDTIQLTAKVFSPDGRECVACELSDSFASLPDFQAMSEAAEAIGLRAAEQMTAHGAQALIHSARSDA